MTLTPDRRLLVLGAVSGALSYFGTLLLDAFPSWVRISRESGTWLPGVFFGGLVLAPRLPAGPMHALRQLGAIGLSALIYRGAVHLAVVQTLTFRIKEVPACAAAGALGALAVAVLARIITPEPLKGRWSRTAAVGALGGAILGISGNYRLPSLVETSTLILGFVVWQAGVGFALFKTENS